MEILLKPAGVCAGVNPAAPITPDTAVVGSLPTMAGWYCIKNGEANPLYMILGSPACAVVREGDIICRAAAAGESPGMMFGLKEVAGNMEMDPDEVELEGGVKGRLFVHVGVGLKGMRLGGRGSGILDIEARPEGKIVVGAPPTGC